MDEAGAEEPFTRDLIKWAGLLIGLFRRQDDWMAEVGDLKSVREWPLVGLPQEGSAADRDQHASVRCRLDCQFGPQPASRKFGRRRSAIRRSSLSMPVPNGRLRRAAQHRDLPHAASEPNAGTWRRRRLCPDNEPCRTLWSAEASANRGRYLDP
jgi:hypothetical protein